MTLRYPANIPGLPGHNWANAIASATPFPPPRHSVATPRRSPRASRACNNVVSTRAPLAPMGCPSATAPPLTFTRERRCSMIDDLRIYSCALAEDEIKALAAGEARSVCSLMVTVSRRRPSLG